MNVFEIIEQVRSRITVGDFLVCLPGLVLLAVWLYRTSLGKNALAGSLPRRNNMPVYLPFVPLLVWVGVAAIAALIKKALPSDSPDWKLAYFDNMFFCIGSAAAMTVIILLARAHFAKRLKGFGLRSKNIFKDFGAGALNLACIYPVVAFVLILTMFLSKLILGPEFEIQKHQQLDVIGRYPQLPVRALIIVTTVAVMPAFEEMLFRGMFQSMIRSFLSSLSPGRSAWLAIAVSSALFASVHANIYHWPALFTLAMCMGYSYEKSGSLFRPIFIHSLFNATSIITVLIST